MNDTIGQVTQLNGGPDFFYLLVPQLALLAIVCAGLLVMIGARRWGFRLLILGIVAATFTGLREGAFASMFELVRQLPPWAQLFLAVMITLGLLRFLLALFLGREAAAIAVGILAAGTISFIFRVAFLPLRFIQRWIQRL